jgi:hypothetical protein
MVSTTQIIGESPPPAGIADQDEATAERPGPDAVPPSAAAPHPDPTRFGDWEKNGRCIDF